MGELMQSIIYYGELAAGAAVWIACSCVLVAGIERVFFKIFPRQASNQVTAAPTAAPATKST